ncbi:MAG: fatty acid CoA ligase family protein [Planctomycetota bacterium]|nr:fatty acid CoA ligase family protein [Planctomycetota bacterium]
MATTRASGLVLRGAPLTPAPGVVNVGAFLPRTARAHPELAAVVAPHGSSGWRTTSYAELDARAAAIAAGLQAEGLTRGDRVALLVRPGLDLIAVTFALFRLGAVPVVVDPGMGARALVRCLARTRPKAFLAIPLAHALRRLHARELASVSIDVVVGPRWFPGSRTLHQIESRGRGVCPPVDVSSDDPAAILFTSGSTGPAKGVLYHHGAFAAQIDALRGLCSIAPGAVDLACFPLFALFDAAFGATCVVPRLDPSRPGRCDPAAIANALLEHRCTYTFGSPAIWSRVVPYAAAAGMRFPDLRGAWIAGAPVAPRLVAAFRALLPPDGDVHTPYGATECLPLTSIAGAELELVRSRIEGGGGSCVGRAVPGAEVALARVEDGAIAAWPGALERGELGEICARGPVVTRSYFDDEHATALAKIPDDRGDTWHRTGDVGWIDDEDRLWIVGRKAHRIETSRGTHDPVPVENVCDLHPRVRRTALVGMGKRGSQDPVLVVEMSDGRVPRGPDGVLITRELEALRLDRLGAVGPNHPPRIAATLFHRGFPVDVRHNAKIRREDLAAWAAEELRERAGR